MKIADADADMRPPPAEVCNFMMRPPLRLSDVPCSSGWPQSPVLPVVGSFFFGTWQTAQVSHADGRLSLSYQRVSLQLTGRGSQATRTRRLGLLEAEAE